MYQALYRKWRPKTFDDVVSQPHITTTLRNQITSGKVAHAYLFTGSRGTGKTTCARIFAKAINCLNAQDGSPCLDCEICDSFDKEQLNDIIEIDAASNTGVDDMRELRESTAFTPEKCRYKVYIIDEVHMLSISAFNALLKILEEPPEHVKFIFATTEVHKVPITIVSRCQRFDFHRIKPEDIKSRLMYIASQEDFTLEETAAELIAKLADGGMRDALSLLDQCIAYSKDVDVTAVSAAAGIAGRDYIFKLIDCFVRRDAAEAVKIISELYGLSKDMQRLVEELISQARNVMLAKTVHDSSLLMCLPDEAALIKDAADKLELADVMRMLTLLQDCSERLPKVAAKRVELEMCVIKICSGMDGIVQKQGAGSSVSNVELDNLSKRVMLIEKALASGGAVDNIAVNKPKYEKLVPDTSPQIAEPKPETKVDISKLKPEDFSPLDCWNDIIDELRDADTALAGFLDRSSAFVYENILLIVVDNDFFLKMFKETKCAQSLAEILKRRFGKAFIIRAKSNKNVNPADADNPVNKLLERAKNADIAVEIKQ